MTRGEKYGGLFGWLLLCYGAGFIASLFEPGSWYRSLTKPGWTPPAWVFAVVWPLLYSCMGIAAWLVWKEGGSGKARQALSWFLLQLVLNALWPWLFFGKQQAGTALGEILLLWIAVLFTTLLFRKKNSAAGWLMLPYLAWISYASALNFAIWQLN